MHHPPEFTSVPDSLQVLEGKEAQLACEAAGKPLPRVTWYRDGQAVKHDGYTRLQAAQDRERELVSSALSVRKADVKRHDGRYLIEAANAVGTVTHEVTLSGTSASSVKA